LYQSTYYIEKSSQTFADNLAAFGMTFVLNVIANGRARVRLEDVGNAFALVCEPELQKKWVIETRFQSGAPFLVTVDSKTRQKMVKGTDFSLDGLPIGGDVVVDYETEKGDNAQFHEWRKSLTKNERKEWMSGALNPPITPHRDWDLFRAVNPAYLRGYNRLVGEWWRGRDAFPEMLEVLLQMTAQLPNDVAGAEKAWEALCKKHGWAVTKRVSAGQLFNPSQGKGTNALKAVWASPNNLYNFWMLEWLKVVGIRYGGFTKLVHGSKDRKTYALVPVHLGWDTHDDVMKKFRQRMVGSSSAIKMDVLASLRYTQALIDHVESARSEDLVAQFLGHPASNFVQGMQMAFYKDMGNAIATMNIASINLPKWVKPETTQDFQSLKEALAEHELIIRVLDESHSDQYDLLKLYRDFLSANDLTPFFRFAISYSGFVMHQLEGRQFVRPFTTSTLEVLFMNSDEPRKAFSQIVKNPGFKNIAYAIRHSTVVPQGRKAKGNKPTVNVRYGLGQQLARKASYPQDFLAEIAKFIHLYNAENAQLRENKRNPFRKNISTEDIESLAKLVDDFGSKVVCNMLIAYGYAREPYKKGEEGADVPELDEAGEGKDDSAAEE
jgi:hypothetical protein